MPTQSLEARLIGGDDGFRSGQCWADRSQERLRAELRAKERLIKELEMSKQETEDMRREKEAMEEEYQVDKP